MFLHSLQYVIQNRKVVFWVTFIVFLSALLYVLTTKRQYESKALLLPPIEERSEGMLTAWMMQLDIPTAALPATAGVTSAAILVDVLGSRRLGEMIVRAFDLREKYKADKMDDALKELRARTNISATTTGLIKLSVKDEDPELAVQIAQHYITGLDSLNRFLQFTRAERTMEFISGQIERYRQELSRIREEIARFQKEHDIVNFDEQVRGAIDVAASLKVKTVLAEIEYNLLRDFARKDALELRRKEAEFQNLTLQLNRMMEGDTAEAVFVPLKRLPELYQTYAAMQRDLEVSERVYSYLLQRYEETGISKARNTPTIQVVDEPSIPEKHAGITEWGIVLLTTLVGFIWISVVVSWWGWQRSKTRSDEDERVLHEIGEVVRQDIERLRKFLRL